MSADRKAADNTVAIDSHALGTLQYIRASLDAAGVLAVPGSAGIAMGAVGIFAALLVSLPALTRHWFGIWLVAGGVAFLCGSALMIHQARSRVVPVYRGPLRKFLMCLSPPLCVGAILTWQLWNHSLMDMVPGVWLLLYGCGAMAASTMTIKPLAAMGACFIALGLAALVVPAGYHNAVLGLGFGGVHVGFGILIGGRQQGSET